VGECLMMDLAHLIMTLHHLLTAVKLHALALVLIGQFLVCLGVMNLRKVTWYQKVLHHIVFSSGIDFFLSLSGSSHQGGSLAIMWVSVKGALSYWLNAMLGALSSCSVGWSKWC
jgi:hypothetical protein